MMSRVTAALTITLILTSTPLLPAEEPASVLALASPSPEFGGQGSIRDGATLLHLISPERRMIGDLNWHTDYATAYRRAQTERKMLFIFFRDERDPFIADVYEHDVLSNFELREPLSGVVRVILPLNAVRPFRIPELPDLPIMNHNSFKFMYGRQGIAMIDLTDPESALFGQVVSAHPFTPGKLYTVRGTKLVLGLPRGSVTQRALIYAVRQHPAAPVSTTDGRCDAYLCRQARQSSQLMSTYGSVGHHDWGTRYGEIAAHTGKSAMEVAAMAGNRQLIDAAIELVEQWYGSPAHWGIMSAPATIFGYDLVHDPAGNWWGTGLFAN